MKIFIKILILITLFLFAVALVAQDTTGVYKPVFTLYASPLGMTAYQLTGNPEIVKKTPYGPNFQLGFIYQDEFFIYGSIGYQSFGVTEFARRRYSFQGGIAGSLTETVFLGITLSYFGDRNAGNGLFGAGPDIVITPFKDTKVGMIMRSGVSFTDEYWAWTAVIGLTYKLSNNENLGTTIPRYTPSFY